MSAPPRGASRLTSKRNTPSRANSRLSLPAVQRLMVMGLVEGAEVELASSAIGGDPIEFRLFGTAISLRREHAAHFSVLPID